MAEIGRWKGHRFEVSPSLILGFSGLTIKGSCETKDKKGGKQKYVTRKNGKPAEVSMTIVLSAALSVDVRKEALTLVEEAEAGLKGYMYVGNKKLLTCKLMLVDASVKEVKIDGSAAAWIRADVSVTMKQCSKFGALPKSGGGKKKKKGSKKKSVRKSGTTTSKKTPTPVTNQKPAQNVSSNNVHFADHNELTKLRNLTLDANQYNRKTTNAAKKYSSNQKAQSQNHGAK